MTDYSSVYVAKVVEVISDDCLGLAPAYYSEKKLDVENWFIISDIRRIVHNDFEHVRDHILGNFTTPNFGDHHYAIYGNKYVYPLVVEMDKTVDYFETENDDFKFFTEIYKSEKSLEMKKNLIDYRFGEDVFYALHPNTQDAIISAEIEYEENKNDPLYDFTSVVIKFSKAFEKEIYLFMRELFLLLIKQDKYLRDIEYSVQGRDFRLSDHKNYKPNIGTNNYLIKNYDIKNAINKHVGNATLRHFIFVSIPKSIQGIQSIRNESVHGESASLAEAVKVRKSLVGIGENGVLSDLIIHKKTLLN